MHNHILIPTDGSELSQNAIDYGMARFSSFARRIRHSSSRLNHCLIVLRLSVT